MLRPLLVLLSLFCGLAVRADILTLRDGSRHQGELIERTPDHVVFRVLSPDGRASALRRFALADVAEIQRGKLPEPAPATQPADAEVAGLSADARVEQMLRESLELMTARDLPAARRALQRTIQAASEAQRADLARLCQAMRGVALDALIADLRLLEALAGSRDRLFDLKPPTRFEHEALGRRLGEIADGLLAREHAGRSIAAWAELPDDYVALHADAPRMAREALLAALLLGERLKYDPRLAADRDLRAALARQRNAVARLAAHVRAMRGFTSLGEPDPDPASLIADKLMQSLGPPEHGGLQQESP